MGWCGLDKNRWWALVNSVLNLRVPWNSGKLSSDLIYVPSGLFSSAQLHRVSYFRYMKCTDFRVVENKGLRRQGRETCTLPLPQSLFSDCWDPTLEFFSDFVLKQGSVKCFLVHIYNMTRLASPSLKFLSFPFYSPLPRVFFCIFLRDQSRKPSRQVSEIMFLSLENWKSSNWISL
jgi:hypothetical protein